jgi:DNA-binding HxlR family transcriptional regulator
MKKGTPCILDQSNTSRKTLDLIANKWAILILFALRNGERRFAEMHRDIGGITEKMLIQTLRNLERDGLVERKVYPVVPPKVEYRISKLGHSLAPVLDAIVAWSYGNLVKVHAARAAYEKKNARKSAATRKDSPHLNGVSVE